MYRKVITPALSGNGLGHGHFRVWFQCLTLANYEGQPGSNINSEDPRLSLKP